MTAAPSTDLEWLASVLWGTPGTSYRIAPAGSRTRGERYAIVPSAARARFLVPARSPRVVRRALRAYNRLRPASVRALRGATGLAVSAGAERLVARDVLEVDVADEAEGLRDFVARVLGREDVALVVGLAPRGPNRKPLVQVFSQQGEPLAFVKMGWNDVTADRVRREAAALAEYGSRSFDVVRVPDLVYEGEWHALEIVVTAPLPRGVRRYASGAGPPLSATRDICALEEPVAAPLEDSQYLESLRGRAAALDGARSNRVSGLLDRTAATFGTVKVPLGVSHGDWVPWNMAREAGTIYVFDWEHRHTRAPLGIDVFHWHFQIHFVLKRRPPRESWDAARDASRSDWQALDIPPDALAPLPALFLADMSLRAAESISDGAMPNPRWEASIDELLDGVLP